MEIIISIIVGLAAFFIFTVVVPHVKWWRAYGVSARCVALIELDDLEHREAALEYAVKTGTLLRDMGHSPEDAGFIVIGSYISRYMVQEESV